MTQFLIFPKNAGNGNIEFHIRKIENPKVHQLQQAVRVCSSYEEALAEKNSLKTESFDKPKN